MQYDPCESGIAWAISQFWHPGHLKLHPTDPTESHVDPGMK